MAAERLDKELVDIKELIQWEGQSTQYTEQQDSIAKMIKEHNVLSSNESYNPIESSVRRSADMETKSEIACCKMMQRDQQLSTYKRA